MIHLDGDSVTIRDVGHSTADYLFDPRLLGITAHYAWRDTLEKKLPYRNARQIETVGREEIVDRPTWHVRAIDSYGQQIDLWIDAEDPARVYRYDFATETIRRETRAFYEDEQFTWLPSRVETREVLNGENVTGKRTISIKRAEADVKLPASTWTLAGLEPPIGVPVSDLRLKQRIGYWDGTGLRPSPPPRP